jgi:hypothetical protein
MLGCNRHVFSTLAVCSVVKKNKLPPYSIQSAEPALVCNKFGLIHYYMITKGTLTNAAVVSTTTPTTALIHLVSNETNNKLERMFAILMWFSDKANSRFWQAFSIRSCLITYPFLNE